MPFVTEIVHGRSTKYLNREHDVVCSILDEAHPDRIGKEYSFVRFVDYKKLIAIYELDSLRIRSQPGYIPGKPENYFSSITRWKYRYLIFEKNSHALMTIECDNKGPQAGEATATELVLPDSSANLSEHIIKVFDEFYLYKCAHWDGLSPDTNIKLNKESLKISLSPKIA
ncbi:hypothetical protein [Chitinibacter tainanensis]|uniref:hypothetical protein n=1 Tax=Chitinibacter tainanensis TaxID=230667 RepID=UPI002355633D|nr:hypothetical protein [Chitinibacter tainanensis]